MKVSRISSNRVHHAGHDYYFCSQHCVEKFSADPAAYSVVALEDVVAGVTLIKGVLTGIVRARRLSRATIAKRKAVTDTSFAKPLESTISMPYLANSPLSAARSA